jgi:hypothetical protein
VQSLQRREHRRNHLLLVPKQYINLLAVDPWLRSESERPGQRSHVRAFNYHTLYLGIKHLRQVGSGVYRSQTEVGVHI